MRRTRLILGTVLAAAGCSRASAKAAGPTDVHVHGNQIVDVLHRADPAAGRQPRVLRIHVRQPDLRAELPQRNPHELDRGRTASRRCSRGESTPCGSP